MSESPKVNIYKGFLIIFNIFARPSGGRAAGNFEFLCSIKIVGGIEKASRWEGEAFGMPAMA
jgi:hypothetical protein